MLSFEDREVAGMVSLLGLAMAEGVIVLMWRENLHAVGVPPMITVDQRSVNNAFRRVHGAGQPASMARPRPAAAAIGCCV